MLFRNELREDFALGRLPTSLIVRRARRTKGVAEAAGDGDDSAYYEAWHAAATEGTAGGTYGD